MRQYPKPNNLAPSCHAGAICFDRPHTPRSKNHARTPQRHTARPAASLGVSEGYNDEAASGLAAYPGRKVMEWFSQKTSIAGTQIPNWVIVLGAIIIILLIYRFM
jgi:hypothetical protein